MSHLTWTNTFLPFYPRLDPVIGFFLISSVMRPLTFFFFFHLLSFREFLFSPTLSSIPFNPRTSCAFLMLNSKGGDGWPRWDPPKGGTKTNEKKEKGKRCLLSSFLCMQKNDTVIIAITPFLIPKTSLLYFGLWRRIFSSSHAHPRTFMDLLGSYLRAHNVGPAVLHGLTQSSLIWMAQLKIQVEKPTTLLML